MNDDRKYRVRSTQSLIHKKGKKFPKGNRSGIIGTLVKQSKWARNTRGIDTDYLKADPKTTKKKTQTNTSFSKKVGKTPKGAPLGKLSPDPPESMPLKKSKKRNKKPLGPGGPLDAM